MEYFLQVLVLIILIYLSGVFSASETALMSLNKINVEQMTGSGMKNAELVKKLKSNPRRLLYALLIGNNLVNISATAYATGLMIKITDSSGGIGIATAVMTVLIITFGEITPKSKATLFSQATATKYAPFVYLVTVITRPVMGIIDAITKFTLKLQGARIDETKPAITQEDLKAIVHVSHQEGVLEGGEKQMIENVFEFKQSFAKDVMTPWTDISAVEVDTGYKDLIDTVREENYSRIPVYEDDIDHIIGILHVKDLLLYDKEKDGIFDLRKYIRKPYFTYEFKPTDELFDQMRKDRITMAIVLDEYGGTTGLVTNEDLIEEIVGEINDEYDEMDSVEYIQNENDYIVNGTMRLDDFNDLLGKELSSEEHETINGFITEHLGRFPKPLETIIFENLIFTILAMKKNRIEKLKVTKVSEDDNEYSEA